MTYRRAASWQKQRLMYGHPEQQEYGQMKDQHHEQ